MIKFSFAHFLCCFCLVFVLPLLCIPMGNVYATSLDYTRLNTAIQNAPYCSNSDGRYSAASWSQYTPVLLSAIDIINKDNATQSEIDNIALSLEVATDSLVYLLDLRNEIKVSQTVVECSSQYSTLTFTDFQQAYTSALNVVNLPNPTQDEVNSSRNILSSTRLGLLDVTRYNLVLTRLPANADMFTTQSYAAVRDILDRIDVALSNYGTTQQHFDQLVYHLDASISGLVYLADTTTLNSLLNTLLQLDVSNYTSNSVSILQNAISDIQDTLTIPELTEIQANLVLNKYQNLPNTLVDISKLRDLVEECSDISATQYAPNSFLEFFTTLTIAQNCLIDPNCTQNDVSNCISDLVLTKGNLIPVADKNKLLQCITTALDLIQSGLTLDNAKLLEQCVEECKLVYLDNTASIDEISIHTALLLSTIHTVQSSQLDITNAKSQLQHLLNYVLSLNPDNYTSFSWFLLQSQYSLAYQVANSSDSNLLSVQDAIYNLQKTTNQLSPSSDSTKPTWLLISIILLMFSSISLCVIFGKMLYEQSTK